MFCKLLCPSSGGFMLSACRSAPFFNHASFCSFLLNVFQFLIYLVIRCSKLNTALQVQFPMHLELQCSQLHSPKFHWPFSANLFHTRIYIYLYLSWQVGACCTQMSSNINAFLSQNMWIGLFFCGYTGWYFSRFNIFPTFLTVLGGPGLLAHSSNNL